MSVTLALNVQPATGEQVAAVESNLSFNLLDTATLGPYIYLPISGKKESAAHNLSFIFNADRETTHHVTLKPIAKGGVNATDYHFKIHLSQNIVQQNSLKITKVIMANDPKHHITASDWEIYPHSGTDAADNIYLGYTGSNDYTLTSTHANYVDFDYQTQASTGPLGLQPGSTITIETYVNDQYVLHSGVTSSQHIPINPELVLPEYVIEAEIVGPNTILNDGVSINTTLLRISNPGFADFPLPGKQIFCVIRFDTVAADNAKADPSTALVHNANVASNFITQVIVDGAVSSHYTIDYDTTDRSWSVSYSASPDGKIPAIPAHDL